MPRPQRPGRLALVCLMAAGCGDSPTTQPEDNANDPAGWPPSLSVVEAAPATCGTPTQVGLMLGSQVTSGAVEVANDASHLYVTYRAHDDRPILATALFVGDDPADIPTGWTGLPRLLLFPYRSGHPDRPREVVWQIPLGDVSGAVAVVAAFAQVGLLPSWGDGLPITQGRDWAMYFTHAVQGCGPEPIGPEGGTATSGDGVAALSVPAGALETPTAITITPITLDALGERVPPEEFDPELGTVYGVKPLPGAILDLGPDGLEFMVPALISVRYEESAIPEGVSEEELGLFVINGIFEPVPSTVDVETNTVTAELSHFSVAFLRGGGDPREVDLEVTGIAFPAGNPVVGEPAEVTAHVRNNGPTPSAAGHVIFDLTGPLTVGPVAGGCGVLIPFPGFENPVRCPLPAIDGGGSVVTVPVAFLPLEQGATLMISATAFTADGSLDTDTNPENDRLEVEVTVQAGAGGGIADLKASSPGLAAGSDPRVGGLMGYVGRVDNLGPGASSGGTLRIEASGDLVAGAVPDGCVAVVPAPPFVAAIECPIEPLGPFGVDFPGTLWFTPQSSGAVGIKLTVTPAVGDTDPDLTNNVVEGEIEVAETFLVDLTPVSQPQVLDSVPLGGPLVFRVRVGNFLPPSNGGTIIYTAHAPFEEVPLTLGDLADGCVDLQPPPANAAVAIECPFAPFSTFVNDTGSVNQPVPVWVGPLRVVPGAAGHVTFTATTVPVESDTDANPANDVLTHTVGRGELTADLVSPEVSAAGPGGPGQEIRAGEEVVVHHGVHNDGPSWVTGARAAVGIIAASGSLELVTPGPGCVQQPTGDVAILSVWCETSALEPGKTLILRQVVRASSPGPLDLGAFVSTLDPAVRDPDSGNNRSSLGIQIF